MEGFSAGWFVVYTKPKHERKIAEQLEHAGISSFLPLVKKLRIWSDRKKYIDAALFPSYLFVQLNDTQSYFRSLEINGVLYYVRNGKQIAVVKNSIIQNLRMITDHLQDTVEVSSECFRPGRTLHIAEGPFTGFSCEVVRHNGKQKALVRIELLQRNVLVDMPVEYLMTDLALQS